MNKKILTLVIITLCFIMISVFARLAFVDSEDPGFTADGYPPGQVTIQLDYLGSKYYEARWSEVGSLLDPLITMGYMKIKINDFNFQYYCTHCEGIGDQGKDLLYFDEDQLDLLHEWCIRNKDKLAEITFEDSLKFQTAEAVAKILEEHEVRFMLRKYSAETDTFEGVKIDLVDGRPKPISDDQHPFAGLEEISLNTVFSNLPPVPTYLADEVLQLLKKEGFDPFEVKQDAQPVK